MAAAGYTLLTSNARRSLRRYRRRKLERQDQAPIRGSAESQLSTLGKLGDADLAHRLRALVVLHRTTTMITPSSTRSTDYGSCNKERQFSQELRWTTPEGEPIEATVGGFLSRQRLQVDSRIRLRPPV
jgi:iron complex outermembrane receptor protein